MRHHYLLLAVMMTVSVPAALNAQATATGSSQATSQGGSTSADQDRQSGATGAGSSSTSTSGQTASPRAGSSQGTTTGAPSTGATSTQGSTASTQDTGAQGTTDSTAGSARGATATGSASGTASGSGAQTTSSQSSSSAQSGGSPSTAPSHWLASGFVGANYSNNTGTLSANGTATGSTSNDTESSADFGFSVGYLWRSLAGAEFLAGFTPNFDVQNGFANIDTDARPQVNSYMFNAMGALPLGSEAQWQPFISGGFGAITLRADNSGTNDNDVTNFFAEDETRTGGNMGFGVMGFAGSWGFRGDIRYFHAFDQDENETAANGTASTTGTGTSTKANGSANENLPGLDFWRANIGVAFRW